MPRNKLSPLDIKIRTEISDNLKKYSHGITQASLSEKTGIPVSTLSGYFAKRSTPNAGSLQKIAEALGVNKSDLDPRFADDEFFSKKDIPNIVSIYERLTPARQQNVYNYADNQLKEQNGKVVNLPLVGKSAANPTELTYGDVEIEHDDFTDVPHGADTAIRIQGDSMEPLIHDGQIIFYHRQEEVENGEIAIVEIDGDGVTCKQIYYDYTSNEVILRSINKKYEPRHVKDDQVRIIGRVIL